MTNLKKSKLPIFLSLFLILLSLLGTFIIYSYLPDTIPQHWNTQGDIDRFGAKTDIFITGFLPLGMLLLFVFLPKIDPKREAYQKFSKAYDLFILIISIFMIAIHWVTILVALGYSIDVSAVISFLVGVLLIFLGNYFTQIRQNYFFGIKNPWTLANETVWKKTHRVGGYLFILSGLVFIATIPLPGSWGFALSIGAVIATVLGTSIYSYLIFKKLK